MNTKRFFSKEAANAGKRVALTEPNGKKTDEWILVAGRDSDAYRKSEADYRKKITEAVAKGEDIPDDGDTLLARTVACVLGWSLEDEFTPENVKELLVNAPYIRDEIDTVIFSRERFFAAEE